MSLPTFSPLAVSSKFAICGLPLRVDTYNTCSHGCVYCFANKRVIMGVNPEPKVGDIDFVRRRLAKVNSDRYEPTNFLERLLKDEVTWHCGGMSDPFQPKEQALGITRQLVDVTNRHGIRVLFSTKGYSTYDTAIRPDLHAFQLSVTNIDNRTDIEPLVAPIDTRYDLYRSLKDRGFRVGIRLQPFIPGVTDSKIVEMFSDADHFTLEGLKLIPQDMEQRRVLLELFGLTPADFVQMGLLNLRPDIRASMYAPVLAVLEKRGIPYSLADNDFHHISKSACCCGDVLVGKSTTFNTAAMCKRYGLDYALGDVMRELGSYRDCVCSHLFASNRQEGCATVGEFFESRFYRKSSPFSPQFLCTPGKLALAQRRTSQLSLL